MYTLIVQHKSLSVNFERTTFGRRVERARSTLPPLNKPARLWYNGPVAQNDRKEHSNCPWVKRPVHSRGHWSSDRSPAHDHLA